MGSREGREEKMKKKKWKQIVKSLNKKKRIETIRQEHDHSLLDHFTHTQPFQMRNEIVSVHPPKIVRPLFLFHHFIFDFLPPYSLTVQNKF